mmetsp:Transcript_36760/g.101104  ORF Transcript_36760/g.101104 Transcript_36760/m.101104 type:complete len:306 (+) Transcript_36760:1450-2367(+)
MRRILYKRATRMRRIMRRSLGENTTFASLSFSTSSQVTIATFVQCDHSRQNDPMAVLMAASTANATMKNQSTCMISSCVVSQALETSVDFGYCRSAPICNPRYCRSIAIRTALIMTRTRKNASKGLLLATSAAFTLKLAMGVSCSDKELMDCDRVSSSRDNLLAKPFCMPEVQTSKLEGPACSDDFCCPHCALAAASSQPCLLFVCTISGVSPPTTMFGAAKFDSIASWLSSASLLTGDRASGDGAAAAAAAILNSLIFACSLLLSTTRAINSLVWAFCSCSKSSAKVYAPRFAVAVCGASASTA